MAATHTSDIMTVKIFLDHHSTKSSNPAMKPAAILDACMALTKVRKHISQSQLLTLCEPSFQGMHRKALTRTLNPKKMSNAPIRELPR
jgi:hypothetical protein